MLYVFVAIAVGGALAGVAGLILTITDFQGLIRVLKTDAEIYRAFGKPRVFLDFSYQQNVIVFNAYKRIVEGQPTPAYLDFSNQKIKQRIVQHRANQKRSQGLFRLAFGGVFSFVAYLLANLLLT